MLGNIISISDIFSGSNSASSQADGQQQFALSRDYLAWNKSAQGQDNLQQTKSPNEVGVRLATPRPRLPGEVDLVDINNVQSTADSESLENQALGQDALVTNPPGLYRRRLFGDAANEGAQRQRSDQASQAYTRIRGQADTPDWDGFLLAGPMAHILVDNVSSTGTAKDTQLQDAGQNSTVRKSGTRRGKTGAYCPPPQVGGDADNDMDQLQENRQRARGRNHVGLYGLLEFACPPAKPGSRISNTYNNGTTDSLQAQAVEQNAVVDNPDNATSDPQKKLDQIAQNGVGVISGETTDTSKVRQGMQEAVTDHLKPGVRPGNEQMQIGTQFAGAAFRGASRNTAVQGQRSEQEVGSAQRWIDFQA